MDEFVELTEQEYLNLSHQLRTYPLWVKAKKLVAQYWADTADGVFVESDSGEYDDEGGTEYRVQTLEVVDVNGDPVGFDLTKPAFKFVYTEGNTIPDVSNHKTILRDIKNLYIWNTKDRIDKGIPEDFALWGFPTSHDSDDVNGEFELDHFMNINLFKRAQ